MFLSMSYALLLASSPIAAAAALDCTLSPQMTGIPATILSYAAQNVTCPVTSAANALIYYQNISSILEYSNDIIEYLKDSSTYLKARAPDGSVLPAQSVIYASDLDDVPFAFGEWTNELVMYKSQIVAQKIEQSLIDGLTQQRAGLSSFIDLVIAVTADSLKSDLHDLLAPTLNELDCAINVFKSDSPVSVCSSTGAPAAASTSMPSTTGSSMASVTGAGASSTSSGTSATQVSPSTSTSTHSGADTVGIGMGLFLVGLLFGSSVL